MEKQRLILFLNRLLANYFVLQIKWYRYQWFVKGEHALTLQGIFLEMQTNWQIDLEKIATHILYLDGKPFASMVKFIKEASLEEAEADDLTSEIFEQINKDLHQIIREIEEEGIPLAKKINDNVTIFFLLQLEMNISNIISKIKNVSFD